ncbi:MAG TPA: hypothetical protein VHB70_18505 [Parafilimonas sp.]|nr:hypothetical protein [Parafilimonas sp.]
MIYKELNNWIAQSESWQAFIDFNIQSQFRARYEFLNRSDDFYIALVSKLYDLLSDENLNEEERNKDLVSIAKGLEIYSLEIKRDNFRGVNFKRNLLYIAALNYLADFPATAFYLLKQVSEKDFSTSIELLLFLFLSRRGNRK